MSLPINISASRGAAILGLSKWKTPVQSWLEIMEARDPGFCENNNYKLPEFEYNSAMKWGHAFESAIVELAENKRYVNITDREKLYVFPEHIFITCHIDGKYNTKNLHEGKTTSYFNFKDNFGDPGTNKVPIENQIQTQHQMICTGADKVIISVLVFPKRVEEWEEMGLDPDDKYISLPEKNGFTIIETVEFAKMLDYMGYFHQYEINAHPELQKSMIKHYADFWNENVLGKKEPTPQSYDDIKCLVREPVGTIIADENIERFMAEYKNIKSELSNTGPLAKRTAQIKVHVLDYMKKAESTLDDDTTDKWILLNQQGKKLASYGKDKNGNFIFR